MLKLEDLGVNDSRTLVVWAEIDDADHLERARELIYPRISRGNTGPK